MASTASLCNFNIVIGSSRDSTSSATLQPFFFFISRRHGTGKAPLSRAYSHIYPADGEGQVVGYYPPERHASSGNGERGRRRLLGHATLTAEVLVQSATGFCLCRSGQLFLAPLCLPWMCLFPCLQHLFFLWALNPQGSRCTPPGDADSCWFWADSAVSGHGRQPGVFLGQEENQKHGRPDWSTRTE